MESNTHIYDNRFSIWRFVVLLITIFFIFAICEVLYYFCLVYWLDTPYITNWQKLLLQYTVISIISLCLLMNYSKSKYRIEGNRFIVNEKPFGINLDIPISTITEVRFAPLRKGGQEGVVIQVGDQTYHLKSSTYKKELYEELSRLVKEAGNVHPAAYFHKEQNKKKS